MEQKAHIRVAAEEDADELLRLYAPYVEQTAITFEYQVPTVEEFRSRIRHTLEKYPYLVAEENGRILGYVYAGPFKARPAYAWAVETTIYVDMERKRSGVGRMLYEALEQALAAQNIVNLNACIAEPIGEDKFLTRDSVLFHERMEYRLVGKFHQCGYKFRRWYDMVWMEKHIGPHLEDQPPVRPFGEVRDILKKEYGIT